MRDAAVAYAEHLLAGGVVRWRDFLTEHDDPASGRDDRGAGSWTGGPPGAAQAELLRRLNGRARRDPEPAPTPELAAHVLRRAAPGRGRVDLLLTDPPQRVAVAELLRVGAGVLADLVADGGLPLAQSPTPPPTPPPTAPPTAPRAGVATRGPTYRLEGPPVTVAALRRRLAAAGLPPGTRRRWWRRGRPDIVLVVALPLHRALLEVWSQRTQAGATKTWPGVLTEWHRRRRLPPGASYVRLAASWAARIGAQRIHVVTDNDLDGQVESALGRRPVGAGGPTLPAPLSPAAVEVLRRTSEVLTFRVPPGEKQQRLDRLVGLLAEQPERSAAGAPGDLPARQRNWVRRAGRRAADGLESGGYVLHGPVTWLGRPGPARSAAARDRAVLAALVEAVLRAQHGVDADSGRRTGA